MLGKVNSLKQSISEFAPLLYQLITNHLTLIDACKDFGNQLSHCSVIVITNRDIILQRKCFKLKRWSITH